VSTVAKTRLRAPFPESEVPIATLLDRVEARIAERLDSREELLTDISKYLIASGGKRVRPAVTILVFRACGGRVADDIVDVAAALELIHSATLLHDDIIDDSDTRRGQESAFHKYGLAKTLVTGDFVFSRAFQLCARFEEKLINWAAEACIALTEGEIMQGRFRNNSAVTVSEYLDIISRKTACIFQQGARTAAYLAGASEATVDQMAQCGHNVGMTFQIVDDVLDIEGDPMQVGKPLAIDLRDGNPSLPVVLALRQDLEVSRFFANPSPTAVEVERARQRILSSGVLIEARRMAADYGSRARDNLLSLKASPDRDQLVTMVDQLLDRAS